ncbi:HAD-IC family P-type ATPase [Ligilactobacillus acidipiscis]|uniref:HAD-IC family P-type ATPase n=1 Tax=Ligilactobacillus acidipiscis TaxID=89059 RepID=UPI0023F8A685|nr:HAD-IC family P-type ATPase [Ligilactobacillus acidipiscis]WEV56220.1 HAD-IC family P-type ATPase [Ligilactobacillus acidipiscis]
MISNNKIEENYQATGLTTQQVQLWHKQHPDIQVKNQGSQWRVFVEQLWGPTPWLLEAAMIFEIVLGKYFQAIVVLGLLLFSAIDSMIQNNQARKALGPLHQKLIVSARAKRDNSWQKVSSKDLVPEDVLHIHIGDVVPADVTVSFGKFEVDQSVLTGESKSMTISKNEEIKAGSLILHGEGIVIVKAVGKESSYGETISLSQTAEAPGRLSALLFRIVRLLAYLDVVLAVILIGTAIFQHVSWQILLPFVAILFIATIPISMPSSFTVANSVEAHRLAKKKILVTGEKGIQESASLDVLLTDKTGTLTENKPKVTGVYPENDITEQTLLDFTISAVDNTSQSQVDQAILAYYDPSKKVNEVIDYQAFDPMIRYASAYIKHDKQIGEVRLGAPDKVLKHIDSVMQKKLEKMSTGQRLLAVSWTPQDKETQIIGFLTLADTLKKNAPDIVTALRKNGVEIKILTGDQLTSTKDVAQAVGLNKPLGQKRNVTDNLDKYSGFTEILPRDKFLIVKKLQEEGKIVGMVGDGINDAPALRQADVGIAVDTATDAAKGAADVVLSSNGLSDILDVVESGHRIYRRMLTWTITKLTRTAELTALLTFGFIISGHFPISLNIIVYNIVLNDLVTLTLGTDRTATVKEPEHWNIPRLAGIASIFTIVWLILGLGQYLWFLHGGMGVAQVSSLMFAFLIYSAMATILMTRTSHSWWTTKTSRLVGTVVSGNVILTTILALTGILIPQVQWSSLLIVVFVTILGMIVLDNLKQWFVHKTHTNI